MTYTKPDVERLGNAVELIESLSNKTTAHFDGGVYANPAYDLDE
jgi:hypothetical protein